MRRIPGLGLGVALLVASELAAAMPFRAAIEAAHRCTSDTSWAEQVGPVGSDEWRPVCGDELGRELVGREPMPVEPEPVCGLYAQWALWACQHGYPTASESCDDAADAAVEECGTW